MSERNDAPKIPTSVLRDAEFVMSRARDVSINHNTLSTLADQVKLRLDKGIDAIESAFGTTGNLEHDVNLIFFETAVNFCFWADSNDTK